MERSVECDSTLIPGRMLRTGTIRRETGATPPCKPADKRQPFHSFGGSTSTRRGCSNPHCWWSSVNHPSSFNWFDSGDGPPAKRRRLNESSADVRFTRTTHYSVLIAQFQAQGYYSQIELEDLQDSQASEGIALDMKNSQRYFESRAVDEEDTSNKQKVALFPLLDKSLTETGPGQHPTSVW